MNYSYDALGRRVHRGEMYGPTTSFTYDGEDVLLSNMSGSVTSYQNGPGIDTGLSIKLAGGSGSSSYTHRDHLGTPIASSTAAGVLTGGTTVADSFGHGVNAFTGREYDSYLELQYSRARMYDPKVGRFISEDPIGFAGGDINLYGYVKNRPTMLRDPSGNIPIIPLIVGGVAIGGLILASPSYVNAPGPCDPGYDSRSDVVANAVIGGAMGYGLRIVGGALWGAAASRFWPRPVQPASGLGDDVASAVYPDGTLVLKGQKPSRLGDPRVSPLAGEAQGPHTVLRFDNVNSRIYQGRTYDAAGNPILDIDFTIPTFPNGTPRPNHAFGEIPPWIPHSGGFMRGDAWIR